MKKTTRKRILSGISALCMIFVGFILPLVQLRGVTADAADMITIEYRIVFGDYNNDGSHNYLNHAPRLWIKSTDDSFGGGFYMNTNEIGTPDSPKPKNQFENVTGNYKATYEIVSNESPARKDWCYQYKLTLTVPKLSEGQGYYINQVQEQRRSNETNYHNAFRIANFTPYILEYDHFNHPGIPDNGGAPSDAYNSNISSVKVNENNKIVYLFLDPITDWKNKDQNGNPKVNPPIDLSMKKRWDGHNYGEVNQHSKEKIEVELQVYDTNAKAWKKYENSNYYNYQSTDGGYTYYNNANGNFVDRTQVSLKSANQVDEKDRLKFLTTEGYKDYYEVVNGVKKYYDKNDLENAPETTDSGKRLILKIPCELCNSIVLSLGGAQHMKDAYYYKWNGLPYGNYRVVETRSFYDVNDNNIYESEIDYDTSSEYNYMLYPPQRDSTGVCHIQNYTATMNLTVQKEWWFKENNVDHQIGNDVITDSEVQFEVYRSTIAGTPYENESKGGFVARDNNGNVGDMIKITAANDTTGVFKTDSTTAMLKLTGDSSDTSATYCPEMKGEEGDKKFYYYVSEISSGAYTQLKCDSNGFVQMTDGSFCTSYDDGDKRVVHIKNKPEIEIKVNKTWTNPADANKEMKFVLLRASENYGNIENEDIVWDNTIEKYIIKNTDKTFKTIDEHEYTTHNQTITFTSAGSPDVVPFKWDSRYNKAQRLYFYVYELDGDGNSYKVSEYDVGISGQAETWDKSNKTRDITVSNSRKSDRLTQVTITKKWIDRNGSEMPIDSTSNFEPINFKLYQSTTEINDISTLSSLTPYKQDTISYSDGWTKTIDNLPKKDDNGKDYYYYVVEDAITNYDTSYDNNGTNSITIYNTDNTIDLTVNKKWETLDGNPPPDERTITVTLVQYNLNTKDVINESYRSATITKNGSFTFENLPTKSLGGAVEYGYNIEETMSDSMAMQYNYYPSKTVNNNTILLENKLKTGTLKVKKEWEGIDEIPDNIQVSIEVYRNGTLIETLNLNKDNKWEQTIENIFVYMGDAGATLCNYRIEETVTDTTTGQAVDDYECEGYYYEFSDPNSGKTEWESLPDKGCSVSEGSTLSFKAVNRKKSFSLPSTGGTGTTVYTVFGAALIFSAVGAYAFISFKKRRFGCKD